MTVRKGSRAFAGALAAVAFAAGCGTPGEFNSSQAGPSPVVLADTSAGQLQIGVYLSMGGYDPTRREGAIVDINFTAAGRPVSFIRNEAVNCNGTALTRYTGAFEGTFRLGDVAGKAMKCVYVSGNQPASITVLAPRRLVILTPREGETVTRSAQTDINYESDPSAVPWAIVGISANVKASALPGAATSSHAALNTSNFTPGRGTIALTQQLDFIEIQAPAFRSVTGRANLMTMVQVVWQ
jgi:hypothetical protein